MSVILPAFLGGADANLPSVLRDNLAVAQQWKSFLLSLVLDCSSSSSNSSGPQADHPHDAGSGTDGHGSSKTSGVGRLAPDQVTAAAMHLLLQDRIDEAEEVLAAHGCLDMTGGGVDGSREVQLATGPFSMQVGLWSSSSSSSICLGCKRQLVCHVDGMLLAEGLRCAHG